MVRNFALLASVCLAGLALPAPGAKLCSDVKGNIVANCGFEDGAYTSGNKKNTNSDVPVDWIASPGFDLDGSANGAVTAPVRTGLGALSIGHGDNQKLAALTQTLTDVAGDDYNGRLWVAYLPDSRKIDPDAFFEVLIDGNPGHLPR